MPVCLTQGTTKSPTMVRRFLQVLVGALLLLSCDSDPVVPHVPAELLDDLISGMTVSEVISMESHQNTRWEYLEGSGEDNEKPARRHKKVVILAPEFRAQSIIGAIELGFGDDLLYSALFSPVNGDELINALRTSNGRPVVPGERIFSDGVLCILGKPIPKYPRGFLWCRDVMLDVRFNDSTDSEQYLDRVRSARPLK